MRNRVFDEIDSWLKKADSDLVKKIASLTDAEEIRAVLIENGLIDKDRSPSPLATSQVLTSPSTSKLTASELASLTSIDLDMVRNMAIQENRRRNLHIIDSWLRNDADSLTVKKIASLTDHEEILAVLIENGLVTEDRQDRLQIRPQKAAKGRENVPPLKEKKPSKQVEKPNILGDISNIFSTKKKLDEKEMDDVLKPELSEKYLNSLWSDAEEEDRNRNNGDYIPFPYNSDSDDDLSSKMSESPPSPLATSQVLTSSSTSKLTVSEVLASINLDTVGNMAIQENRRRNLEFDKQISATNTNEIIEALAKTNSTELLTDLQKIIRPSPDYEKNMKAVLKNHYQEIGLNTKHQAEAIILADLELIQAVANAREKIIDLNNDRLSDFIKNVGSNEDITFRLQTIGVSKANIKVLESHPEVLNPLYLGAVEKTQTNLINSKISEMYDEYFIDKVNNLLIVRLNDLTKFSLENAADVEVFKSALEKAVKKAAGKETELLPTDKGKETEGKNVNIAKVNIAKEITNLSVEQVRSIQNHIQQQLDIYAKFLSTAIVKDISEDNINLLAKPDVLYALANRSLSNSTLKTFKDEIKKANIISDAEDAMLEKITLDQMRNIQEALQNQIKNEVQDIVRNISDVNHSIIPDPDSLFALTHQSLKNENLQHFRDQLIQALNKTNSVTSAKIKNMSREQLGEIQDTIQAHLNKRTSTLSNDISKGIDNRNIFNRKNVNKADLLKLSTKSLSTTVLEKDFKSELIRVLNATGMNSAVINNMNVNQLRSIRTSIRNKVEQLTTAKANEITDNIRNGSVLTDAAVKNKLFNLAHNPDFTSETGTNDFKRELNDALTKKSNSMDAAVINVMSSQQLIAIQASIQTQMLYEDLVSFMDHPKGKNGMEALFNLMYPPGGDFVERLKNNKRLLGIESIPGPIIDNLRDYQITNLQKLATQQCQKTVKNKIIAKVNERNNIELSGALYEINDSTTTSNTRTLLKNNALDVEGLKDRNTHDQYVYFIESMDKSKINEIHDSVKTRINKNEVGFVNDIGSKDGQINKILDPNSAALLALSNPATVPQELYKNRDELNFNVPLEILNKLHPDACKYLVNKAQNQLEANAITQDVINEISKQDANKITLTIPDKNLLDDMANPTTPNNFKDDIVEFSRGKVEVNKKNIPALTDVHFKAIENHAKFQQIKNTIIQNNLYLDAINHLGLDNTNGIKDYLRSNKLVLKIDDSFINGLTPAQTNEIFLSAATRAMQNNIVEKIQQGLVNHQLLKDLNTTLVNLPNIIRNGVNKRALGIDNINNNDLIIAHLTPKQLTNISYVADEQLKLNQKIEQHIRDIESRINSTKKANDQIFNVIDVPDLTTDLSEINKRMQSVFSKIITTVDQNIIGQFSVEQTKRIYDQLLKRLGDLDHYYKFANKFAGNVKIFEELISPPLRKYYDDLSPAAEKTKFLASLAPLSDPNTPKATIQAFLNDPALQAAGLTYANELGAEMFAENQYQRIYHDVDTPPSLKAEFDAQNLNGKKKHQNIIDKLQLKDTPQQINDLVAAVKSKGIENDELPNALNNLGLDPNRTETYLSKREHERLLDKYRTDPFLGPLLVANKASIEDKIETDLHSSADVDTLISRILNSDKANLVNNLDAIGITHWPDPRGGLAPPIEIEKNNPHDAQVYFGKLAYRHLHHIGGTTLVARLNSADRNAIESRLGTATDLKKIDKLKLQSKENLANYIENDLGLGTVLVPPPADGGPALPQAFSITDADAKQIFAEVQHQRMVDVTQKKRPGSILHTQLIDHANKTKIINQIKDSDEINTSRDIVTLYNRLNDAETDVDLRNAARDLGFTYPDLNAAVKANKDNRFDKTTSARMSPIDFQRIKNNLDSYKKWLDHFLIQTEHAKAEESNRRTIEQTKNAAFELKLQLTAFKNECEKKVADGDTEIPHFMANHFNDDPINRRRGLNSYLAKDGTIDKIIKNTDKILTKLSPAAIAYYQPSGNKAEATPVDSYEEALKGMSKFFGKNVHKHDVAGSIGTGTSLERHGIDRRETISWIPMDICINRDDPSSPPEYVRAAAVRRKDEDNTKNARLDFFFKSKEDMAKLVNVKRESDSLLNLNSIPGMPIMEWAAAQIKTLRSMCDDKLAPIFLDDKGMAKELKESIQLYCNYKGYDCRPPGSFNDTQIETFKKRWVDGTADKLPIHADDLGIREIMKLKADTTLKPAPQQEVPNTNHRFHS